MERKAGGGEEYKLYIGKGTYFALLGKLELNATRNEHESEEQKKSENGQRKKEELSNRL